MIERLELQRGVILDLGCGHGAVAEPLSELGYEYVGADIDGVELERLTLRGYEAHVLDLRQGGELAGRLAEVAEGRHVAAVLMLDVLEHLPETQPSLLALRDGLTRLGRPPLVLSVPNVAHADLGAKLVFGAWEYTRTGLLDRTHLQLFTAERLRTETRASGLLEVDANDFELRISDQHFPADHPALAWTSPIAQTLRSWRTLADSYGETVQFIRAFVVSDLEARAPAARTKVGERRFLTVVMRTQGLRPANLREALTCLAAQTADDFLVLLMVHSDYPDRALPETQAIVAEFHETFSSRVEVVHIAGGDRARPLNAALARLKSQYVAFLDDDDLVTADWVESFSRLADGGAIVRSVAAVRHVAAPLESEQVPYLVQSALDFRYDLDFDPVHHLWGNETPICTFAVPVSLIERFGLRFDETLPILEDWDFLMRCTPLTPVRDTREVTSIYQMWRRGESSASLHDIELWQATQRVLQGRTNQRPLVFPAGTAARLIAMCQQIAELDAARNAAAEAIAQAQHHAQEVQRLTHDIQSLHHEYMVTINSRRWRVLGPLARLAAAVRGLLGRGARSG
jgi:SAM-dependent methyltransferase